MIGDNLSHFKITEKLGEGGMGEVYRAQDSKLGREVAIKVLPEAVAGDSERLARFEREAKLLASLNHPNIGAIHGLEEADGRQFLVLELVEGDTLAERIARGPIPVRQSLEIARSIAEALEAAHQQGIIHRDLKPANVKLTPEGKVKVLDFGLAKAWEPKSVSGSGPLLTQSPTLSAQMTEAGMLLGTAAYMSPEQARGEAVDKRADVWAFGCVLLEMLTGRKTFEGRTVTDVIASVVAREPEWEALPTDTPPTLKRLLRRCLEKEPEQRLRDIADARLEIEEILVGKTAEAVPAAAPQTRRQVLLTAAAAVLAVATLVLAVFLWRALQREQPVVRSFIPAPEGTSFHLEAVHPGPVVVSPDGRRLAFTARDQDGKVLLWVRELRDLEARALAGTEGASYPFWSPDSTRLGFFAGGKLRKIDAGGGPPLTLCEASNGKGGTWNQDDVILFAPTHASPLHRVPAAGGESTPITEMDAESKENSHRHPRFLPGGRHYLYLARLLVGGPTEEGHRVILASLDGDDRRELMRSASNVEYAAGHLLFVRENTLMARPFDPDRLELTGEAFPVAEDVAFLPGSVLGIFSPSEAGVLAYQTGSGFAARASLVWRDRGGNEVGEVGEPVDRWEVHLSPDGQSAAVSVNDPESGNGDVWIWDLTRGLKTRFTFDAADDWALAWSPEGDRIAFGSPRQGQYDLFVKPVGGGGEAELLYSDEINKYPLSWSPDGGHLLYLGVDAKGEFDIWALPLEGEKKPFKIQASDFTENWGTVSPDGRWLAYRSNESGRNEIYVTRFPAGGRKWQVSTQGGSLPRWRRDGRELFYLAADGNLMAADVNGSGETSVVGRVQALFPLSGVGSGGHDYDVTADGQRFLVNTATETSTPPPLTLVLNWTEDLPGR